MKATIDMNNLLPDYKTAKPYLLAQSAIKSAGRIGYFNIITLGVVGLLAWEQ